MNNINNISRLFVEKQLDINLTITLIPMQSHYLVNVMRKKTGDYIRIFNGIDGEWLGKIVDLHKKTGVKVTLKQKIRKQDTLKELWLVFAPIKQSRFHFLLEKAAELGVTKLIPIITTRTIVANINIEKCKAILIEAVEQSNRLTIPIVEKIQKLSDFISHWNSNEIIVLCNENEKNILMMKEANKLIKDNIKTVMVGPEGGFAPDELSKLLESPMIRSMSLGSQILRSETAVLAAITCIQMMRVFNE